MLQRGATTGLTSIAAGEQEEHSRFFIRPALRSHDGGRSDFRNWGFGSSNCCN
jgi:hypothetical protein